MDANFLNKVTEIFYKYPNGYITKNEKKYNLI